MNWQIENLKIVCGDNGKFVSITPELASLLLSLPSIEGEENRKPSIPAVYQYARDMSAGEWHHSHSPIIIGKNNVLINGQHRLLAIVKSEKTVEMFIVFDDRYESPRDYLGDEGVKRSSSYTLRLTNHEASLAREFFSICSRSANPSKHEIYDAWKKIEVDYKRTIVTNSHKKIISSVSVMLGAIAAAKKSGDYGYCAETYSKMMSAEQDMSPYAFSLYRQLVIDRKVMTRQEMLAKTYRGFDPSRAHMTKMTIKDQDAVYLEAVQILKGLFNA